MIYFWRIWLDGEEQVDPSKEVLVRKLNECPSTSLTTTYCFVTGIENALRKGTRAYFDVILTSRDLVNNNH